MFKAAFALGALLKLLQRSHWIIIINVWKCKLIFPTDTLQQNISNHFLAAENTCVLIILATTVNVALFVFLY